MQTSEMHSKEGGDTIERWAQGTLVGPEKIHAADRLDQQWSCSA